MPVKLNEYGIHAERIGTLSGLFQRRVARTPRAIAYLQYNSAKRKWQRYSWQEMGHLVALWQQALARENLAPGERVAIMLNNCVEWVCFDIAALSLQLVVVALNSSASPEDAAYILENSGARLLLVGQQEHWSPLAAHRNRLHFLQKVLCVQLDAAPDSASTPDLQSITDWLDQGTPELSDYAVNRDAIATIVYALKYAEHPKGIVLTHHNILSNVRAALRVMGSGHKDSYVSFLPLSQLAERVLGYYIPIMCGARVVFARSAETLPEDLVKHRPTMLIASPGVYEQFYAEVQQRLGEKGSLARVLFKWTETLGARRLELMQEEGKDLGVFRRMLWRILKRLVADRVLARLGGRLRLAVSSAPLSAQVTRCLGGLGLPLIQGYGLPEAAALVTLNRPGKNVPDSVGESLPGVELSIGNKGELLVRAPSVMPGYWNSAEDTRRILDKDGWLHTGERVEIVDEHVFISGPSQSYAQGDG